MHQERGMFRVYQCPKCNNIGFVRIENEHESSHCSLCSAVIIDEPGTLYAATTIEAEELVRDLVHQKRRERKAPKIHYGLGIRRTLIEIVESLLELNRGWPVPIEDVLREATILGFSLTKSSKMLHKLIEEEVLFKDDNLIGIVRGEIV